VSPSNSRKILLCLRLSGTHRPLVFLTNLHSAVWGTPQHTYTATRSFLPPRTPVTQPGGTTGPKPQFFVLRRSAGVSALGLFRNNNAEPSRRTRPSARSPPKSPRRLRFPSAHWHALTRTPTHSARREFVTLPAAGAARPAWRVSTHELRAHARDSEERKPSNAKEGATG